MYVKEHDCSHFLGNVVRVLHHILACKNPFMDLARLLPLRVQLFYRVLSRIFRLGENILKVMVGGGLEL